MVLIMTILYIMITIALIPKILEIYDLPGIHFIFEWVSKMTSSRVTFGISTEFKLVF